MPFSHFGTPRGARGWLAAQVVARLTGDANRWMLECLEVGPEDHVLDVGCGPGLAVAAAVEAGCARVVGVDASQTMVRQARRRNRTAARRGLVEIHRADAARLPFPDASFTRVGSLNSLQFWPSPDDGLGELRRVLAPGGRVAVVLMARSDDPVGPEPPPWMEQTADRIRAAGFADLRVTSQAFGGVVHRALVGRPSQRTRPPERVAPDTTPRRTGSGRAPGPSIRTMYGLSSPEAET